MPVLIARAANPFKMEKLWTDAYNNGLSKVFLCLCIKLVNKAAKRGGKAGASLFLFLLSSAVLAYYAVSESVEQTLQLHNLAFQFRAYVGVGNEHAPV